MARCMLLPIAIALLSPAAGCAVVKATQQPDKKDMGVLSNGTPRTHVIAELGPPVWTEDREGATIDVFAFKQGYSKVNKASRALIHGAADVATFGLWEVVGIPAETLANGTEVQVQVSYDADQNVRSVDVIKGSNAVYAKTRPHVVADRPSAATADRKIR